MDVRDVDLVDDTVDTFPEEFPHHSLMFDSTGLFFHELLLDGSEFVGRNVDTSCADRFGGVLGFEFFIELFDEKIRGLFESLDQGRVLVLLLGNFMNLFGLYVISKDLELVLGM